MSFFHTYTPFTNEVEVEDWEKDFNIKAKPTKKTLFELHQGLSS